MARSAGFCFGVRKAIAIALDTVQSAATVETLADIVHNEEVVRGMLDAGITRVDRLSEGSGRTLLITAHGMPLSTVDEARRLGYGIVDATCPMVKEIHRIAADMERKGYEIIIIGDRDHDEVKGIAGHLKTDPVVIHCVGDAGARNVLAIEKGAAVVQSTQNRDRVLQIVDVLKRRVREFEFFDTICAPTRVRQEETKTMALHSDVMVVVGSKTSANTRRLYEIARSKNRRSYLIQSKKDVQLRWFQGARTVGVASGASTPDAITTDVVQYIAQFND